MGDIKNKVAGLYNRLYGKQKALKLYVTDNPSKSAQKNWVYTIVMDLDKALEDVNTHFKDFSRDRVARQINTAAEYLDKNFKYVNPNTIFFEFKEGETLNRLNNAVTAGFYKTLARLKVYEYELRTILSKEAPSIITMDKPLYKQDHEGMMGKPELEARKVTYLIDEFTSKKGIGRYFMYEIENMINYGKIRKIGYDIEKFYTDASINHNLNIIVHGTNNTFDNKYGGTSTYISLKSMIETFIIEEFPQFKDFDIHITLW